MDKILLKQNGNMPQITMTSDEANAAHSNSAAAAAVAAYAHRLAPGGAYTIVANTMEARKQSTDTLRRLVLVAQALESEAETQRRSEINGSRIVATIRSTNLLLMVRCFLSLVLRKSKI